MKLIFCPECEDVVRLRDKPRRCECGKSSGMYEADGLHALIGGDAVLLGIENSSFRRALVQRNDLGPDFGFPFTAFIIPDSSPRVKRGKVRET